MSRGEYEPTGTLRDNDIVGAIADAIGKNVGKLKPQVIRKDEQDHANFIEEYAEMTQAFMTDQEAQWNKWFKEKQTELSGDIAGKLQLQIDDVKEKVYNIAFKVYIISTLEQITSPVTVKLTNKTTGTMQTVTVTKSQMGFYVTEAGEYTVEADLESVMVTPKAFKVTNDNLMTTQNITLREGSNLGYIGNYIGSFIAQ